MKKNNFEYGRNTYSARSLYETSAYACYLHIIIGNIFAKSKKNCVILILELIHDSDYIFIWFDTPMYGIWHIYICFNFEGE